MAWNEKTARKFVQTRQNGPGMDRFDEEASREGRACSIAREALPSVMGSKIQGCKGRYKSTQIGTSRNIGMLRERKFGFGA